MKFLIDNNLSPGIAQRLNELGHDAVHVRDLGMSAARDPVILERASAEDRVIISADTDFAELLALRGLAKPSFILFRRGVADRAAAQLALLEPRLSSLEAHLKSGCIAVIRAEGTRIRSLPVERDQD